MSEETNNQDKPKAEFKSPFLVPEAVLFDKICGRRSCSKKFKHASRNAKFCSTACQQKEAKRKKESKKAYDANKGVERLYSRSHSMAVEVINQLVLMGERENACETCGCKSITDDKVEGKKLEVHHRDVNWLNNSPENLGLFCIAHHAQEHVKINARMKAGNQVLHDILPVEMKPFLDVKLVRKG